LQNQKRAAKFFLEIKNRASAVVANSQSVADYVHAGTVIPNSFESELARLWQAPSSKEKFVIGVFGSLGNLNPIEPLLRVLTELKREKPGLYEKIKVLQIGQVDSNWLKNQLTEHGHNEIFDIKGYQGRSRAIPLLSEAALFYFGVAPEIGPGVTPIRLYTIMSSGRLALAFAPGGSEVERLLDSTGCGFRFDYDNIDKAVNFLTIQAEKFLNGESNIRPMPDYSKEYAEEKMVEKFARVFESVLKS
jgi:hypothetical protein